ncbi:MAG: UDP-N-acetylglucosamine--N-acetylmuramyl-(pentapeptide) pyrophosphoryl-undecaprenol N-acetylglucosamine transferase [Clostridia bacterium]|nr:UDP-N-acetylglucosamine--N-acetylmuramyl-(pentapeptide) pyrophosphoryl-undecaprenol N-acetylglucosamine transferase [Clostridia bacterium]
MLKTVIACGGTGGHIMPALAMADMIKANFSGARIMFVGTEQGMENALVTAAGYPIKTFRVLGLPRKVSLRAVHALYLAQRALREAKSFLKEWQPHIVIGTGGYACYPTLRAAAELRIPTAVHESNAVPGLAVRLLSDRVDRVWLNFAEAGGYFKDQNRLLTVGNPLRGIMEGNGEKRPLPHGCKQMVLSFGGSLGAERINAAVLEMMRWEREHPEIYHLHATGKHGYEEFMKNFSAAGLQGEKHLEVRAFIADMPRQMAASDVTVCRAGAMSISELAAYGKAAILIPSPNVTGNHQYINAKALADKNAACLLRESELTGEELVRQISRLLQDHEARRTMSENIRCFSRPDAGRLIYEDMRYLLKTANY